MKKEGLSKSLKNLVLYDEIDAELTKQAGDQGLALHSYASVLQEGEKTAEKEYPFIETHPEDVYIFSYTSGTTGDSKGVKLSHSNVIASTLGVDFYVVPEPDDI